MSGTIGDAGEQAPSSDAELEREVRERREFSIAEALGRLAGPGGMKGASPVSLVHQAQAEAERLIRDHLSDPVGVLLGVLIRDIREGRPLLDHLGQPATGVISHVRGILASAEQLRELVRMTDMAWGETMGERPCFERDGQPADPDDPYTTASVRTALTSLLAGLEGSAG